MVYRAGFEPAFSSFRGKRSRPDSPNDSETGDNQVIFGPLAWTVLHLHMGIEPIIAPARGCLLQLAHEAWSS